MMVHDLLYIVKNKYAAAEDSSASISSIPLAP